MDREKWVAACAVGTIAMVALVAAVVESREPRLATALASTAVVKAPPLAPSRLAQPDTRSMGAVAACSQCGVVESVIAVHGRIKGKTEAVGFLMNIRMDDGSTRTVENRGALAAGSRVIVEGETVRARGPST